MKLFSTQEKPIQKKFILLIPPLLLIIGNLFLFGPGTILAGNFEELETGLLNLLPAYVLPITIIFVVLSAVGLFLSDKVFSLYHSLLTAAGILLWVQGNWLVWDIGQIGATDIQWGQKNWRGWVDLAVWLLVIILFLLFHQKLTKLRNPLIYSLLVMQCLYLGVLSYKKPGIWTKHTTSTQIPDREIFQFSQQQNVIHVILDELGLNVFQEIINSDREKYDQLFEGFTLYTNTTGNFPKTLMSVPALISGEIYKNDTPITKFLDAVYTGPTIANTLYDHHYGVDMVSTAGVTRHRKGKYSHFFLIGGSYGGTQAENNRLKAIEVLKLGLFRQVPYFFKKGVYEHKITAKSANSGPEDVMAGLHLTSNAFLQDMVNNAVIARRQPVYKFIHLTSTHWPPILNNNCLYDGKPKAWNWENIQTQAKCAVDQFTQFLQTLKDKGIYDAALIIFHGDHGYWSVPDSASKIPIRNANTVLTGYPRDNREYFAGIVSSAMPTLAIKLPYEKGPIKTSFAPACLSDLPATIYDLLKIPGNYKGRSILTLSENELRKRYFFYYDILNKQEEDHFPLLDEFLILGDPLDKKSWTYLTEHVGINFFKTIDIDMTSIDANQYLGPGWLYYDGADGESPNWWGMGEMASLYIQIPKNIGVRLEVQAKAPTCSVAPTIQVKVNGKLKTRWTLHTGPWTFQNANYWETFTIDLPIDYARPETSTIDFIFSKCPESVFPDDRKVMFNTIRILELE